MSSVNGKVILLGEHFVAYGGKALASTIDLRLTIRLEPSLTSSHTLFLNGKAFEDDQSYAMVKAVFAPLSIHDYVTIYVESEIPLASGLGSSSAFIVCLLKTLNEYYGLSLSVLQINDLAFKVEQQFSSVISGIDNTTITYGSLLLFQQQKFTPIKLNRKIQILLINSGISSSTPTVLKKARCFIQEHQERFQSMVASSNVLVAQGVSALQSNDLKQLGLLCMQNHSLLQELGVSHPVIEEILVIANNNHAYGGKVTGAGCGGFVIVIAEEYTLLIEAYRVRGYQTFLTTLGDIHD